jgi:hypothetical protein
MNSIDLIKTDKNKDVKLITSGFSMFIKKIMFANVERVS